MIVIIAFFILHVNINLNVKLFVFVAGGELQSNYQ